MSREVYETFTRMTARRRDRGRPLMRFQLTKKRRSEVRKRQHRKQETKVRGKNAGWEARSGG